MTWFKVDDTLAFHHKVVAAGVSAMGLWVRAGSWCAQTLTDGFVPEHMVPALADGDAGLAERLVEAKLWRRVKGGYAFHQWAERQPSRQSIEDRRAVRADAGRKGGVRSGQVRARGGSKTEASASSKTEASASAGLEPPTRPDPTRTNGGPVGMPAARKATRAREAGRQAGRTEHPSPADLDTTATRHGGYALVARWVLDNPGVTTAQQRKLAKAVDELLAQRADPTLIPAALDEAHQSNWRDPVKSLPSAYDRVRRDAHPSPTAPNRNGAVDRVPTTTARVAAIQALKRGTGEAS